MARTHKDLWTLATDPAEKERQLRLAYEFYSEAYQLTRGYYTGINAATLALFRGDRAGARQLAREVRVLCLETLQRLAGSGSDAYWAEATLGEAALILGAWSEAEDWYSKAGERGRGRFADLSATRRQARLLLAHLGGDPHRFDHCFRIPRVAVCTSQLSEHPGQALSQLPPPLVGQVRQEMLARLQQVDAGIGYALAVGGADIVFLEAMLERGGEINVVLPFPEAEVRKARVDRLPRADWEKRFGQVLKRAASVYTVSEYRSPDQTVADAYANLFLEGMATLRAQMLDTELEVVDVAELLANTSVELAPGTASSPTPLEATAQPHFPQQIRAMLFADAVGYSKLTEEQVPLFGLHFLQPVAKLAARSPNELLEKNTWGDALYFVFASVTAAGKFALDLRDLFRGVEWAKVGLPETLGIRIALHAGPVYSRIEPVTERPDYCGSHVSLASRIEPITPPDHVYASQAFVALAAAQGVTEFACDYVGRVPLAKGYGTFPMYHVRRRHPVEALGDKMKADPQA